MSEDPCALGVRYIDAQLLALNAHAALFAKWIEHGEPPPDLNAAAGLLEHRHAKPEAHTHSEDGMPLRDASATAWPTLADASQRMSFALNVPCANAIVAVANFFDVHNLSASRTPEVQFLLRLRDAALNADTFTLAPGEHAPHAAFGGLVIDEKLDGHALFGDGARAGFIAFGDVVGLLGYLRKLLKSMQKIVSSGDAG
jgi:hypothetical protein